MCGAQFKQILKGAKECGGARKFVIKESDKDSKLKAVTIKSFKHDDALLVKFNQKNKPWSPYLKQSGDHLKSCDAVLVTYIKNTSYLIFIEMKSESLDNPDIEKQFRGTQCFMDYCDSILRRCYKNKNNLLEKSKERFVVIYKPRSPKTPTRRKDNAVPDSPDHALYHPYTGPVRIERLV